MYAVFFSSVTPPELLRIFDNYFKKTNDGIDYLGCTETQQFGLFLKCHLVHDEDDKNPWIVQIPIAFILAIADMRD